MVRGLSEPSQRPHFKATIVHKPLQARYKQLPGGGSLRATNLDHQKLGRALAAPPCHRVYVLVCTLSFLLAVCHPARSSTSRMRFFLPAPTSLAKFSKAIE